MSEPLAAGTSIGIGEDDDIERCVELIDCEAKIIYFFSAALRATGDDYVRGRDASGLIRA